MPLNSYAAYAELLPRCTCMFFTRVATQLSSMAFGAVVRAEAEYVSNLVDRLIGCHTI